jgi:DNA topoisomerase III
MSRYLIVAEKPSVAADIAKALGGFSRSADGFFERGDVVVGCAVGHLVQLHVPEAEGGDVSLPIIPRQFRLDVAEGKSKAFHALKKLMNRNDITAVINACDAGREGELIFRYIYQLASCEKPIRRMWLQSMTQDAIRQAFISHRDGKDFEALFHAAQCRSESDWLVGINGSRAASALARKQGASSVSVGRVQTPTLALVVRRELEIRGFRPEDYWEVHATFGAPTGMYPGRWFDVSSKDTEASSRFQFMAQADAVVYRCAGKNPDRVEDSVHEQRVSPPRLFDLTTLQREANAKFGFSAQKTLDLAQSLYDSRHGVLSYPRTASTALPQDYPATVLEILSKFTNSIYGGYVSSIQSEGWVDGSNRRVFDDGRITDHFAIIPTGAIPVGLDADQQRIFDLVMRRFLAAFFPDAVFSQTVRVTSIGADHFRTTGRVLIVEGWHAVYAHGARDDEGEQAELCPAPVASDLVTRSMSIKSLQTKPPKRYTESTLLSAMESAGQFVDDEELREAIKEGGLGTPATRASIIERLLSTKSGLLQRDKKNLVPTDKGIALIEFLQGNDLSSLTSPAMTGEWEKRLLEMESGRYQRSSFMSEIADLTRGIVVKIQKKLDSNEMLMGDIPEAHENWPCPTCKKPMTDSGVSVIVCGPCQIKIWRVVAGKRLTDAQISTLLTARELPVMDGFFSKDKKPFSAGLRISDVGKIEFVYNKTVAEKQGVIGAKCPRCGANVMDRGELFACEKDDFKLWKKLAGHRLTKEQAERLINTGRHPKISGFISAKGSAFSAAIKLSDDFSRVEFEFK